VKDNGYGITPEIQNLLFKQVFTSNNTGANWDGTGTGTAIIRKLVEQMMGVIIFYSNQGET